MIIQTIQQMRAKETEYQTQNKNLQTVLFLFDFQPFIIELSSKRWRKSQKKQILLMRK